MASFWTVWKSVALPVVKELLIPLAGGVVYGTIVGSAKQSPLDGATAGGVAFFCLLAAQGLVLRATTTKAPIAQPVPKTTPTPAPEIADDVIGIRSGIEALKAQGVWPEIGPEKPEDGQKPLFRNLAYSVAKKTPVEALAPGQLLALKMPYQAVLSAAVNFERDVRRQADIPDGRAMPLARLFREPRFNLSKEKIQQLDTLRQMRNGILQGGETLVYPLEAAELVAAFEEAASWFGPPRDDQAR